MQRWGMTVPLPGLSLAEQGPLVCELEALGYTDLWTQETGEYDAFVPLALAAAWTRHARLGSAIASVFGRGPALLAMQAAALADAAPGRFVLGIGASTPTIAEGWNAARFTRPLARVRDVLRFLRRALAGDRVDERFETFAVRGFQLARPPAQPPPIFLAALRERMLALAAEEADGVLLSLVSADDVRRIAPLVGGRELELRIAVFPTRDAERARSLARPMLARYLNVPVYARLHDWLGRSEALSACRAAWSRGERDAAARALPAALVDEFVIHGPPESCREQLARFVAAGITTPVIGLWPPDGNLRQTLRALAPAGR